MIFVLAEKEPVLFLMLSEQDVIAMRKGNTKFVDQRQLKGATFNQVVVSLSRTDNDSLEMLRKAGNRVEGLVNPEPYPNQSKCVGCEGLIETVHLFEDKCIVCWASQAKKLGIQSN